MTKNRYGVDEDYEAMMADIGSKYKSPEAKPGKAKKKPYTSLVWRAFRWLIKKILGESWENPI